MSVSFPSRSIFDTKMNIIIKKGEFLTQDNVDDIVEHYLGLNEHDQRFRFFQKVTDESVREWIKHSGSSVFFFVKTEKVDSVCVLCVNHEKNFAEIAISTSESARGRGLAGLLIDEALLYSEEIGIENALIECDPKNFSCIAIMINKFGFSFKYEDGTMFGSTKIKNN